MVLQKPTLVVNLRKGMPLAQAGQAPAHAAPLHAIMTWHVILCICICAHGAQGQRDANQCVYDHLCMAKVNC